MEVLSSNFETALRRFGQEVQGAMYAAIDMELTGTSIDKMPDCYEETVPERISKTCRVAESHVPIQIGVTLVKHADNGFQCSSYNFYAFPWTGPELLGQDQSFLCKASALLFNAENNRIDFNKWLKHAVPYMSREDESNYLAHTISRGDTDLPRKTGLLRVWKLLCEAQVPLITHCPLDIFFLLSCFERRHLPQDPAEMARLVQQCLPCVFDTAHLQGAIGGFKSLQLVKFLEEARARHSDVVVSQGCLPCSFELAQETAQRYGGGDFAHDAGFDSLCTAQLYAYLLNLSPEKVAQSANRLFLYKSTEYLDLSLAAKDGKPGSSIFDLSWTSAIVVRLCQASESTKRRALRRISKEGFIYRWMNSSHVLVSINCTGDAAISAVSDLNSMVPDVQFLPFEEWQLEQRASKFKNSDAIKETHLSSSQSPLLGQSAVSPALTSCDYAWSDASSESQKWLDSNAVFDDGVRYCGVVKRFHASGGYGFITCPETFALFKLDVFAHHSQMAAVRVGQKVSFTVSLNSRGQPQANDLRAVDTESWSLSFDMDTDEGRTTVGASSDCASSSDLDSIKDGSSRGSDVQHRLASLAWLEGGVTVA